MRWYATMRGYAMRRGNEEGIQCNHGKLGGGNRRLDLLRQGNMAVDSGVLDRCKPVLGGR